jgi:hypothetical protein
MRKLGFDGAAAANPVSPARIAIVAAITQASLTSCVKIVEDVV